MQVGFHQNNFPQTGPFTMEAAAMANSFPLQGHEPLVVTVHPKPVGFIIGEKIAPIVKRLGDIWLNLNQSKPTPGPVNQAKPTPGPVNKA